MYKLRKLFLFIFVVLTSIFVINIDNVDAFDQDFSIAPGSNPGNADSCGWNNCYVIGTAGVRFALVDEKGEIVNTPSGSKGKVVDYWFYRTDLGDVCLNGNNCGVSYLLDGQAFKYFAFKKKFLKQEIMNMSLADMDTQLDENYGSFKSTGFWSIQPIYSDITNNSLWPSGWPSIKHDPHVRRTSSAYTIGKKIKDDGKNKNYTMLNSILKEMGYGDSAATTFPNKGYYLQIEPIMAWGNRRTYNKSFSLFVFYGTPSELISLSWKTYVAEPKASSKIRQYGIFDDYNINTNFLGTSNCASDCYHEDGIHADNQNAMPNNFNATSDEAAKRSIFFEVVNGKYNGYAVGYVKLSDIGIEEKNCPVKVIEAYNKYVKGKSDSINSDSNTAKYDAAVDEACKEVGISNCSWLKWLNNGGNFRNYALSGKLDGGTLDSCAKPSCSTVAAARASASFNDVYGKGYYVYIKNLVRVMIGLPTEDGIDGSIVFNTKSLQQAIKLLKILYGDQFEYGNNERVNNIVLYQVFGKTSSNYCGSTTCNDMLNYLTNNRSNMNKLSEKVGGKYSINKTKLEMLYAMYPYYDMIDPEMLMDDSGKIDYNIAQCTAIPKCDSGSVVNASCQKSQNKFTFTDAIKDENYNGGNIFSMNATTFAKLTSGNSANNPTCLNKGYAYTTVNGTRLEKKNMQKSKIDGEYNGESNCWESVTFDLPTSIDKDNSIEAGNIFRWGKGDVKDTKSNVYGIMKITRYCTISPYASSENTTKIGSEWANVVNGKALIGATANSGVTSTAIPSTSYNNTAKVNPTIKLHYQEAVPSSFTAKYPEKTYDLSVELTSVRSSVFERKINGSISNTIDIDEIDYTNDACSKPGNTLQQCMDAINSVGDHPRSTTVTRTAHPNFFNYGGIVETTAEYNIVYGDNLKWYSDMSDNFTKKTEKELKSAGKNSSDAKYISLGYGLPTSFITPSLPKSTTYSYHYGFNYDNVTNGGKMYITISNIGTKTSGGYHFNNLLKTSVKAVSDDDVDNKNTNELVYSCGFHISNHIYCNECHSEKKGLYTCNVSGICKPNDVAPKNIDVVFRTVELVDAKDTSKAAENLAIAFPGRSGTGRTRGINWTRVYGTDVANHAIADILTKEVYNSNPKYVIDLDTVTIRKIREDNNKDSYTSLEKYKFSNIKYGPEYPKKINSVLAGDISSSCTALGINKESCYKHNIIVDIYSTMSTNDGSKTVNNTIDYTYAASEFISDLIKDKKLTGVCAKESDTKKRAENFAPILGC